MPMDKEPKLYELAYLISPALTEEEARDFHQTIKNKVQDLGGLIDQEGEIQKKKLMYKIEKMYEAYLAFARFMLPAEKIKDLKESIRDKKILRSLLVQTKRSTSVPRKPFVTIKPEEKTKDLAGATAQNKPEVDTA